MPPPDISNYRQMYPPHLKQEIGHRASIHDHQMNKHPHHDSQVSSPPQQQHPSMHHGDYPPHMGGGGGGGPVGGSGQMQGHHPSMHPSHMGPTSPGKFFLNDCIFQSIPIY